MTVTGLARSAAVDLRAPRRRAQSPYLETARLGHGGALAMVHEAGGDRVQVLDLETRTAGRSAWRRAPAGAGQGRWGAARRGALSADSQPSEFVESGWHSQSAPGSQLNTFYSFSMFHRRKWRR